MNVRKLEMTSHYEKGPGHCLITIASQCLKFTLRFTNHKNLVITSHYEKYTTDEILNTNYILHLLSTVPAISTRGVKRLQLTSPSAASVKLRYLDRTMVTWTILFSYSPMTSKSWWSVNTSLGDRSLGYVWCQSLPSSMTSPHKDSAAIPHVSAYKRFLETTRTSFDFWSLGIIRAILPQGPNQHRELLFKCEKAEWTYFAVWDERLKLLRVETRCSKYQFVCNHVERARLVLEDRRSLLVKYVNSPAGLHEPLG